MTELPYTGAPDALVRGSADAAGIDLRITEAISMQAGESKMVGTGVNVAIPTGHFGLVVVRSSLGMKGLTLANAAGIIDSDYRGEIKVALHSFVAIDLAAGERVAQMIVVPFAVLTPVNVDVLDDTARGQGGFGSTGTA
jgi:dUTP pyrophosphatase